MKFEQREYENLMNLIQNDEAFFFKDFSFEEKTYRIFNYRLASWTSFQAPGAMNARGVMYDITDLQNVKLVSLPPEKFFNYEEGGVDHTVGKFGDKMVKMDGSLISTYLHNGQLYLKSKGSLFSDQANAAMKLLNKPQNQQYKDELTRLALMNYTVNLEYTSPDNRIVLPYQSEELTVLSARSHEDGRNLFATKLKNLLISLSDFEATLQHMVSYESLHTQEINQVEYMDAIRQEQDGEGYVIEVILNENESYLTKGKNLKYVALHQTKDSVNSPKKLFEAIILEASDDLRAMFATDEYVLHKIKEMEDHIQPIFNHLIHTVETFYESNKSLDRKDFAIKAKNEQPKFMGLIMNLYVGHKNDYKTYALSKKVRKDLFAIGDEDPELDDNS